MAVGIGIPRAVPCAIAGPIVIDAAVVAVVRRKVATVVIIAVVWRSCRHSVAVSRREVATIIAVIRRRYRHIVAIVRWVVWHIAGSSDWRIARGTHRRISSRARGRTAGGISRVGR